ncbi:hypothetical protein QYE76_056688 [Lolium multiflorum]|uniref:Uncharacterized protein n=1 Tax=Lolium multiflorum TaxID=4521 RepID=A0AAD8WN26_LOLMU|nr:hypothetical protein QYE76_056688 [Lolium multiflorum]
MYPRHSSHETVRYWNAGWFYVKNIKVPDIHEGLPKFINKPPEELDSWSFIPALAQFPKLDKATRRIFWLVHDGAKRSRVNTQKPITKYLRMSPVVPPITPTPPSTSNPGPHLTPPEAQPSPDPAAEAQPEIIPVSSEKGGGSCSATKRAAPEEPQDKIPEEAEVNYHDKAEASAKDVIGASSSLATTSSELENLRSAYKDLETKLTEAETKRERVEKPLAEKKSELLQKEADFVTKRKVDSDTLKKIQNEVHGLRNYMTTTEKGWDLLNADVMEPLGYDEDRRNQFPRDDLIRLAGDDCKDPHAGKSATTWLLRREQDRDVRDLIKRMDALPELVLDLQASSARGAAQMSLAMCLARSPELDIDLATTGVPPDANVCALLDACSGYDTQIARRIRHNEFYDKVVLPADEALEAEYAKEREAEARPVGSGDEGQITWTSSKDKSKDGATSPTEEAEDDDDEGAVSSLAKEVEDEQTQAEDEDRSSPAKEN